MLINSIDKSGVNSKKISDQFQQVILNSIRNILPDEMIEQTCEEVGYRFRRHKITPIITVLHMVMAAIRLSADVLRSRRPDGIRKEIIARLAALNIVRSIMLEAAAMAKLEDPLRISFVHAVRAIISFSAALSHVPLELVWDVYEAMPAEIASHVNPKRQGRLEPREVCRENKHYSSLKTTRAQWRINHAA